MRQIEPKMIDFIDERLALNGLAQEAMFNKDSRLIMIEAAKVCVGIREKTNRNDGPMVELIQETVGGHSGEAWCMAFVQTMIAYAEVKTGLKSPIPASEHCMTTWRKSPKQQRVKTLPLPGAIIIWNHKGSDAGHTGLVYGADRTRMFGIEGNTTFGKNNNGKIVREGGGVYFTERSMQSFPKLKPEAAAPEMRLIGFLKPF